MRALRLATRGSPLALEQARRVQARLAAVHAGLPTELVVVESGGDLHAGTPIHSLGGSGVFVAEIEQAVLAGRADVAVHSLKDLPSSALPAGLVLAATPERLDVRDALVGRTLARLAPGAVVATGAVRRRAQLAWLRPDLCFAELRGSIATRLGRVPPAGAVVVAVAALERLGLLDRAAEILPTAVMLPQVGQGAIGLRCREDDAATILLVSAIDDPLVARAVAAERAFLARLGVGCDAPVGAHATCDSLTGPVTLDGLLAREDGHVLVRRQLTGDDPVELGTALAGHLLDDEGGRSLGAPFDGGSATATRAGGPLSGWRVVVTRPAAQAPPLVAALVARGAEVVELATISLEDPADGGAALRAAAREVAGFDWVVFTSANAVAVALRRDPRRVGTWGRAGRGDRCRHGEGPRRPGGRGRARARPLRRRGARRPVPAGARRRAGAAAPGGGGARGPARGAAPARLGGGGRRGVPDGALGAVPGGARGVPGGRRGGVHLVVDG